VTVPTPRQVKRNVCVVGRLTVSNRMVSRRVTNSGAYSMNTCNRIVSCSVLIALLGVSGCVFGRGPGHHGDQREHQRGNRHGAQHDDHDRHSYVDCDKQKEDCPERVLYAL